ncbi:hypothetical protein VVYB158_18735 [Vibrio vulnificus CladeA-yb158]|uniref:hypothetical protein n=1 Tax=Vibrio vulnificus TaxID=672 RepID=UPI00063DBF5C|nr:hypothetical protein [Vibrio vulnificus]KLI66027.1 hypothetical protein VVYB158_18735 [Vibrio vulnificus CladeA-yb158]HDY8173689.1 hypothetical protein [Vibrio vulnificus]
MGLSRYCKEVQLISVYPEFSNSSPNLHVEVIEIPSHRYELNYTSVSLDRVRDFDKHRELWALFESLRPGRSFRWKPPYLSTIRGVGGNALAMETKAGLHEVVAYNAPSNVTWLKSGDLINFANHGKVYMVCEDVLTNHAGMGTLTLNSPLKKSLSAGDVVIGTGAEFTLIKKPGSRPQSFEVKAGSSRFTYAKVEFIEFL